VPESRTPAFPKAIPGDIGDGRALPFLKWTGGKRLLAASIIQQFPASFSRYHEPFLGSGAVFFRLAPQVAHLSDINADLVNLYSVIRDHLDALLQRLSRLSINKDFYYKMRASRPTCPVDRAVRVLYLNKTAFNGIYRVNKRGDFNVPFGCKPGTILCDEPQLRSASENLQGVQLSAIDFQQATSAAAPGDLIYADPPYTTKHNSNGFLRYNETFFSWSDQERLAASLLAANKRGVHVVVSNAHSEDVRRLYPRFTILTLRRFTCISGNRRGRGEVQEYLLLSPDLTSPDSQPL
jgi:DNA adenine methylase